MKEPNIAFQSWLLEESKNSGANGAFQKSSQIVYTSIWNHFIDALSLNRRSLTNVSTTELQQFIQSLDAKLEHRDRYRLLLVRVFAYLVKVGLRGNNPAAELTARDFKTARNAPTPFLTQTQRSALFHACAGVNGSEATRLQDAAITALLLGSGIKVAELLSCTVNCINLKDGWVNLNASAAIRPHRTVLLSAASGPLQAWIESGHPSKRALFPAIKITSRTASIDAASVFRGVRRICEAVPMLASEPQRVSPQTLRNSFAATLMDQRKDAELITEYLGLSRPSSAMRLMASYAAWHRQLRATASQL